MRSFQDLYDIAAERKGGAPALEARLFTPLPAAIIAAGDDSRWLSAMTKCLFQAGFTWKVIEAKWPGFEEAFHGFAPARCAAFHDQDFDDLIGDRRIVRNGAKIKAVMENALFLCDLAHEHGSAARFFAAWPDQDCTGLLEILKKRGVRLGGVTGQRVLRLMGKDGFILSGDVCARLIAEGVVDKTPSSKRDMAAVQAAFIAWSAQSGRPFAQISQILGMSVGR